MSGPRNPPLPSVPSQSRRNRSCRKKLFFLRHSSSIASTFKLPATTTLSTPLSARRCSKFHLPRIFFVVRNLSKNQRMKKGISSKFHPLESSFFFVFLYLKNRRSNKTESSKPPSSSPSKPSKTFVLNLEAFEAFRPSRPLPNPRPPSTFSFKDFEGFQAPLRKGKLDMLPSGSRVLCQVPPPISSPKNLTLKLRNHCLQRSCRSWQLNFVKGLFFLQEKVSPRSNNTKGKWIGVPTKIQRNGKAVGNSILEVCKPWRGTSKFLCAEGQIFLFDLRTKVASKASKASKEGRSLLRPHLRSLRKPLSFVLPSKPSKPPPSKPSKPLRPHLRSLRSSLSSSLRSFRSKPPFFVLTFKACFISSS